MKKLTLLLFVTLIIVLSTVTIQAATGPGDVCEVKDEVTLPLDDGPITRILYCFQTYLPLTTNGG